MKWWRFFVVFFLQGITVAVLVIAMQSGNNEMVTFASGAAVMVFVLMLIIWLMSVISADRSA